MPLMQWNYSFSVGVTEVDTQHKNLVSYLNDLNFAMVPRRREHDVPILADTASGIYPGTFCNRRKIHPQVNYPGYVYHKGEHEAFVKKVAEFKAKFDGGQAVLSIEILAFLKDGVINHIQGTDKKYGPSSTSMD